MTIDEIVSSIRKRYRKRALDLLIHLKTHPSALFYNSEGVATIEGSEIKGSSIKDLD